MFGEGNDNFAPTASSMFAAAAEIPPAIVDGHGKDAALLAFTLDEDRCRVIQQ